MLVEKDFYEECLATERKYVSQFINIDGLSDKAVDALFDCYATNEYQAVTGEAYSA